LLPERLGALVVLIGGFEIRLRDALVARDAGVVAAFKLFSS